MDELKQLFSDAYHAAMTAVVMMESNPVINASTVWKIRMEVDKSAAKILTLEERLKGNPPPKEGE